MGMDEPINVLVTHKLEAHLVEQLRGISPRFNITLHPAHAAGEIPPDVWAEVEVLFTSNVLPDKTMAPNLRWVQANSAGVDSLLDNPLFETRDVMLTTASGIHAVIMAEYALGMMLAFSHRILTMVAHQAEHDWPRKKEAFEARSLRGTTLGVVGYGSIGRELARMAQAMGMNVLATKRNLMQPNSRTEYVLPGTGDPDSEMVQRMYPPQALCSMVKDCDYVVVLLPKTAETANLFDAKTVAAMKPGAVLVNLGRGGIIDEEAVLAALESGALGGAAFDVFADEPLPEDNPLWDAPNLIVSPHIAGIMPDYMDKSVDLFADNLERYLAHRDLINLVDWTRGY